MFILKIIESVLAANPVETSAQVPSPSSTNGKQIIATAYSNYKLGLF